MRRKWLYILPFLVCLACPATLFCEEPIRPEHLPDEVLVQFRPDVSEPLAQATHGFVGATTIKRFRRVGVDHVRVPQGWTAEETAELYRLDPDVESAEPNYYRSATATPDDTHLNLQWALHNMGQTGGTQDTDLDGPEAWDVTTGSDSIVIAVIDTGADLDHQDLAGNIWRELQ